MASRLLTKHLHLLFRKILPLVLGEYSEDRSGTFLTCICLRRGLFNMTLDTVPHRT
jgi:hypothetical protein